MHIFFPTGTSWFSGLEDRKITSSSDSSYGPSIAAYCSILQHLVRLSFNGQNFWTLSGNALIFVGKRSSSQSQKLATTVGKHKFLLRCVMRDKTSIWSSALCLLQVRALNGLAGYCAHLADTPLLLIANISKYLWPEARGARHAPTWEKTKAEVGDTGGALEHLRTSQNMTNFEFTYVIVGIYNISMISVCKYIYYIHTR